MITKPPTVWIGWDPNEMRACVVAHNSAHFHSDIVLTYERLALMRLKGMGFYTRPMSRVNGQLWDAISEAPMSTEHAISRFFVPFLEDYTGWAVFMDGDVLVRSDLKDLFALADPQYAVMVVKHPAGPQGGAVKKDGHLQTIYQRKNWSSVMLWNCGHPANKALELGMVNTLPGRELHRFCWLKDREIGELSPGWNYLVGVTEPVPVPIHIAHFTLGVPKSPDDSVLAREWWEIASMTGYDSEMITGVKVRGPRR